MKTHCYWPLTLLALLTIFSQVASAQLVRLDNDLLLSEFNPEIPGIAETEDCFGCSIVVGDFNGDGFGDVAIGVPGRDIDGLDAAGRVLVVSGSATGPDLSLVAEWHRNNGTVKDSAAHGEEFGSVMAVGNFNGDAFDDLALGVPNANVDFVGEAGEVVILHGSANGLTAGLPDDQLWRREDLGDPRSDEDHFGAALAAGDINNDGRDELAIGVPGATIGGDVGAGIVYILSGSSAGLTSTGVTSFSQDHPVFVDSAEPEDLFGSSLAIADFNGDGHGDLVVGAPGEDTGGDLNQGLVNFFRGSANGLVPLPGDFGFGDEGAFSSETLTTCDFNADGYQDLVIGAPRFGDPDLPDAGGLYVLLGDKENLLTIFAPLIQSLEGFDNPPESFDNFSRSLAAADFNADGFCDLAIGVPGESFEDMGIVAAGMVHVIRGSVNVLEPPSQDLSESDSDILGFADPADLFGIGLAAGDLDGDKASELLVGVLQDFQGVQDGGTLHIFSGDGSIFADGFESGDLGRWSLAVGN